MSVWKLAIVAAGTALVLAGCGGGSSNNGGSTSCTPAVGTTSGTGDKTVKVVSDPNTTGKFDPSSISVSVGQSVEWDFQDQSTQHSVTADDSGGFDSCLQSAGAKFVVTFSKAGDFKYHCTIHAQMTAAVKVG